MTPRWARTLGLTLVLWLAWSAPARAHDPGLSALELRPEGDALAARLTLSWLDAARLVPLDADGDGSVSPTELEAARPALEALALGAIEVRLAGRTLSPSEPRIELDASGAVHLWLLFRSPAGTQKPPSAATHTPDGLIAAGTGLQVRVLLLERLPRGHRTYLSLRDPGGALLTERVLGAGVDSFGFETEPAGPAVAPPEGPHSFRQFLTLGIEHILTGYDHLAFLLALLVAGGSLRSAAKIITSFTVAHSLTLALATFGLVHLPSRVTEPLIAASIVYVGLENVFQREHAKRWLLTFGFGLVHGFGFASVLRDLGIGARGLGAAVPLFSFNFGVEIGQISIALLTLPVIWQLSRRPSFATRTVPACSITVALLGSWWLLQRTVLA